MSMDARTIDVAFNDWHKQEAGVCDPTCPNRGVERAGFFAGARWVEKILQSIEASLSETIPLLRAELRDLKKTADDRYETIVALRTCENECINGLRAENKKLTETAQAQFNTIQNLKMRAASIPPPASIEVAGLQWELNRERDMYRQFTIEKDGEINRLAQEVNKLARDNQSLKGWLDDRANTINGMSATIVKKDREIVELREKLAQGSFQACVQCEEDKAAVLNELQGLRERLIELAGFTRFV